MNSIMPKWLVQTLGGLLVALLALLVISQAYNLSELLSNKNPKNTISISAEGKVVAVPDLATVNIGVLTSGSTANDVQTESSKKINSIIEFVKKQGIEKDDINTSEFSIYPQQDYREGRTVITGYQANQSITIKVRGVDKTTEKLTSILGGVTSNGANQVNGVSMSFDDPDNLKQQARKAAIEKAKQKAQDLASSAGLRLGKVVNVSESGSGYGVPVPMDAYGYGGAGIAMEKAVSPNVEPGNQDVVANMTVTFEVK